MSSLIKYKTLLWSSLLLVLAGLLKGWNIVETDIGGDECFSVYNAQLSVKEITTWLFKGNNPPLWEILLHFWIQPFGVSELSIRSLSLLFNVGTVLPIIYIGERFIGKKAGFYTALLFIFSSFSLFLAHEARVYSLIGFLVAWSVYFFLDIIHKGQPNASWLGLTVVNGLILYSHYMAYWIPVMEGAIVLFIYRNLIKKYLIHLGTLLLIGAPIVPVLFKRMLDSGVNGTWVKTSSGIDAFYFLLVDYWNKPLVTVLFIVVMVIGLIKWGITKEKKKNKVILHLFVWLPLGISFIISFKLGILLNRYFYFLLPILYLSFVSVLYQFNNQQKWGTRWLLLVSVLAMLLSFEVSTKEALYSGTHIEIKPVAEQIKQIQKEEAATIYFAPVFFDKEIVYYWDRHLFQTYFDDYQTERVFKKPLNKNKIYPIYNATELVESTGEKVVFIDNKSAYHHPNNNILNTLSSRYRLVKTENIAGITFYYFEGA
ncbi:MAG: glycosyltransferase family 39 protein [Flavobacteriales bacterium]|jgi:hypothetical protein|nr:glycosyltransferase family 39 protein [Flavobacteriales bacterium]